MIFIKIVILSFFFWFHFLYNGVSSSESSCSVSMGNFLPNSTINYHDNGDMTHNNKLYKKNNYYRDKNNSIFICVCDDNIINNNNNNGNPCIRKCCMDDEYLEDTDRPECVKHTSITPLIKFNEKQLSFDLKNNNNVTNLFKIINNRYCPDKMLRLIPEESDDDNWFIYKNGSIYAIDKIHHQSRYCIDWLKNFNTVTALICVEMNDDSNYDKIKTEDIIYPIGILLSVPFLIATLVVYSIIPELKNLYGKTLMCYVGCLVIAFCLLFGGRLVYSGSTLCTVIAFTIHFSFLASFFWLNVMCFDIWWTFGSKPGKMVEHVNGGFRSLAGSVKQREKKKFIFYSLYAWGSASILTGICLIMDFVPEIPDNFIKPRFGVGVCWFVDDVAKAIYFYGPMGITVICNIILFISTALKIRQHKKDTAHHLKGMDSRRHDDNKQWFNLYLKLFIVMGINWSLEIISWLVKDKYLDNIWLITDLANTLQGVIIFIIFVWKDKIKRLLLKKIGWQNRNSQSRNSTRNHSSTSRTVTSTMTPLQDKTINLQYKDRICVTTDESDCL